MKRLLLVALALLTGVSIATAQDSTAQVQAKTPDEICAANVPASDPATRSYPQMEQVLQPGVNYRAIFCTAVGSVYVDLFEDYAPQTVDSFVFLATQGYFNNTTFHRVIQDFMAQGGDPTATGTGGPGYQFKNEAVGFLYFDQPGLLAMANAGPDTNGSQFFITTSSQPLSSLDYKYSIFGRVLEGQESVNNIRLRDPASDPNPGTALNTVVIITDPTTVQTSYEPPPLATPDQVVAGFNNIANVIPPSLGLQPTTSGSLTEEQVVASTPQGAQRDYSNFLTAHNFQYRVSGTLSNTSCNLTNTQFLTATYTLDAFDTPADAAAALSDGFLNQLPTQEGFTDQTTPSTLAFPMFTYQTTTCNNAVERALTYWQRGRFVVTVQADVLATLVSGGQVTPDQYLNQPVGIVYERALSSVLRAEIR